MSVDIFKVDYIFEKFDLDRDGKLTLDEFIDGCLRDEYLSNIFKTTFLASSASYTGITATTPSIKTPSIVISSCGSSSGGSTSSSTHGTAKKALKHIESVPITTATMKVRSNSVNDTASTASSSMTTSGDNLKAINDNDKHHELKAKRMMFLSHNNLAYGSTSRYDDDDDDYAHNLDDDDSCPANKKDYY